VFGIVVAVVSYSNLFSWNVQSFDTGTVPIAANSSNELGFYTGFGSDLKKVEVIVDNGPWHLNSAWGECVWITRSFDMSLLGGQGSSGNSVGITTASSPRVDYTFDVPSSWNVLDGVRISNPENQPVSVNVEVIFQRQVLNSSWQTAMIIGLIVAVAGIVFVALGFLYSPRKTPPPPGNPQ
jgi:hypothetical protein